MTQIRLESGLKQVRKCCCSGRWTVPARGLCSSRSRSA